MDKENVLYLYNSALIRREILPRGRAIMNPEDVMLNEISHKRTNTGGSDGKSSACNVGDLGPIPGQEAPLGKGMATHSSIFVWRTAWTEEPCRL